MLEDLFSSFMPGQVASQDAQAPSLENQWNAYFKDPKVQAGLLSFGMELMKPKWTQGAALPDALGAAGRTVAAEEELQRNIGLKREDREAKEAESERERQNRLKIAGISADSRADVANIRTQAMIEGIRLKDQLRTQPMSAEELKSYQKDKETNIAKLSDENFLKNEKDKKTLQQINKEAEEQAWNNVLARRVRFQGTPVEESNATSPNLSAPGPTSAPIGKQGGASAPKTTSPTLRQTTPVNPAEATQRQGLPTTADYINEFKRKNNAAALENIDMLQKLKLRVRDPQAVDLMIRALEAKNIQRQRMPDMGWGVP